MPDPNEYPAEAEAEEQLTSNEVAQKRNMTAEYNQGAPSPEDGKPGGVAPPVQEEPVPADRPLHPRTVAEMEAGKAAVAAYSGEPAPPPEPAPEPITTGSETTGTDPNLT